MANHRKSAVMLPKHRAKYKGKPRMNGIGYQINMPQMCLNISYTKKLKTPKIAMCVLYLNQPAILKSV